MEAVGEGKRRREEEEQPAPEAEERGCPDNLMTVRGTAAHEAMKNQEMRKTSQTKIGPRSLWHIRRARRKAAAEVAIKGKLRMKSPSGAFVILGVFVVLLGMTIAVIGYWPHKGLHAALDDPTRNTSSTDKTNEMKAVAALSRNFSSNDRLKLIGPVIMGVGLFIFICANTMLYENRDMETRLLIQQSLYSMAIGLPSNASEESKYCQKTDVSSVKTRIEEGFYETDLCPGALQIFLSPGKRWAESFVPNKLQTTAQLLHQNGISPSISLRSIQSDSCNFGEGAHRLLFTHGESIVTSTVNTLSLPVIKLNNCLIESSDVSQLANDEEVECPKERDDSFNRSWNLLPKTDGCSSGKGLNGCHVVINVEHLPRTNTRVKGLLTPESARKQFSSEIHLNVAGHSKSVDLSRRGSKSMTPAEERKNRSWPRLDRISLIGYTKLENTEDSVDKLLDQFTQENSKGERTKQISGDMA
ncbi:transmembrane protein 200B [Rhinatrema bivittatum]|uniref:transmembrane protein 200B n=1 Tax=Rhinatrema bivittatum TaxID=194408 RepID=UPI00112BD89B|nr:transmembrane protein 200B [Rhinatrema bivittatum]